MYTMIGLVAGTAIFLVTHHMANPAPHTLTKEWQEATNEYFKVGTVNRTSLCEKLDLCILTNHHHYRRIGSSPSLVQVARTTGARVRCRVHQQVSNTNLSAPWSNNVLLARHLVPLEKTLQGIAQPHHHFPRIRSRRAKGMGGRETVACILRACHCTNLQIPMARLQQLFYTISVHSSPPLLDPGR
jgi:hypothetical protein